MNLTFNLSKFMNIPLNSDSRGKVSPLPQCSNCGYILERPHALICTRCGTSVPGARGCSGCGRCRQK